MWTRRAALTAALVWSLCATGCGLFTPLEERAGEDAGGADAAPDANDSSEPDAGPDASSMMGCEARDEVCNGVDDDCDGDVDEGCVDGDGDGWCAASPGAPGGEGLCSEAGLDCDDALASTNPGNPFVCGSDTGACPLELGLPVLDDASLLAGDRSARMADLFASGTSNDLVALWVEVGAKSVELRMDALRPDASVRGNSDLVLPTQGQVERAAATLNPSTGEIGVVWLEREDVTTQSRLMFQLVSSDLDTFGEPIEVDPDVYGARLEIIPSRSWFSIVFTERLNGATESQLTHSACSRDVDVVACRPGVALNMSHEAVGANNRFWSIPSAEPEGPRRIGVLGPMVGNDSLRRVTLFDGINGTRVPYAQPVAQRYALPDGYEDATIQTFGVTDEGLAHYVVFDTKDDGSRTYTVLPMLEDGTATGEDAVALPTRSGGLQMVPLNFDQQGPNVDVGAITRVRVFSITPGDVSYLESGLGGSVLRLSNVARPADSDTNQPLRYDIGSGTLDAMRVVRSATGWVVASPGIEGFPLHAQDASQWDQGPTRREADLKLDVRSAQESLGEPMNVDFVAALSDASSFAIVGDYLDDEGEAQGKEVIFVPLSSDQEISRSSFPLPEQLTRCTNLMLGGDDVLCGLVEDAAGTVCERRVRLWDLPLEDLPGRMGAQSWGKRIDWTLTPEGGDTDGACCIDRPRSAQSFRIGANWVTPVSAFRAAPGGCAAEGATFTNSPLGNSRTYARDYGDYGRWRGLLVANETRTAVVPVNWGTLIPGETVRLARAERLPTGDGAILFVETDEATHVALMTTITEDLNWRTVGVPLAVPAERAGAGAAYALTSEDGAVVLSVLGRREADGALVLERHDLSGASGPSARVVRELGADEFELAAVSLEDRGDGALAAVWSVEPNSDALETQTFHEITLLSDAPDASDVGVTVDSSEAPLLGGDALHLLAFWIDTRTETVAAFDMSTGEELGRDVRLRFDGDVSEVRHWPVTAKRMRWFVSDGDSLRVNDGICVPPNAAPDPGPTQGE